MNILFKINYYIFKKYKYLNNIKIKTQKNCFMFKVKKKSSKYIMTWIFLILRMILKCRNHQTPLSYKSVF